MFEEAKINITYKYIQDIQLHLKIKKRKLPAMNRRNVIKGIGVVTLYSTFPTVISGFLLSWQAKDKMLRAGFFSDEEFNLLTQVSDIILPRTSTPGAVDAGAPFFIDLVVKDCMNKNDQQIIKKGLQDLSTINSKPFSSLTAKEKNETIKNIDENAFKDGPDKSWFRIVKKLALIGYFTSQEGMTKALNYVQVPGDYKGIVPYKKGDKAMAKTFLMYW